MASESPVALRRAWWLAAAGLGLVAGALSTASGLPEPSGADGAWQLPPAKSLRWMDPADAEALARQGAWQQPVDARAARRDARRVQWRLAGIVSDGGGTALVVANKEVLRLRAGETLPDGATLQAVQADRIVVAENGCRRTLPLYADPKAASEPECDTPGQPAD